MRINWYWVRSLLLLSLWWTVVGCTATAAPPPGIDVTIDRVISGQTVIVRGIPTDPTAAYTIRLQGIHAPDLQQVPWGETARQALETQLRSTPTATLVLNRAEPDVYDRYWGDLWQGNEWINRWLVAQGHVLATFTPHPSPPAQELSHAQDYARMRGAGLWNPDAPLRQTPAEFRRGTP
ncbi:thermonuclease family protein [Spirulina major]|uniref:thermonuclease family protein n=1 Tax=Spirulina major TaxID=270636 RepID=UPI00093313B1|nr:thermonuclease family protein [Spirulina major]